MLQYVREFMNLILKAFHAENLDHILNLFCHTFKDQMEFIVQCSLKLMDIRELYLSGTEFEETQVQVQTYFY